MTAWSFTLRSLAVQTGTAYELEAPGPAGLGNPPARTQDQERGQFAGDVGGDDVFQRRVITIPVAVLGAAGDPDDCRTKLRALQTAWRLSDADLDLTMVVAGETLTYSGRPRGCEADVELLGQGVCRALLTFEALVPYAAGSSESVPVP